VNIEDENLTEKVVLEVGSGRGDTTRKLLALLSKHAGAQLIVSDISDIFFPPLREEFKTSDIPIQFVCTAAQELLGIPDQSVDYLVCNYTLCAVNAQAGSIALALKRFHDVLKVGGKLFLEEEFPIDKQDTPAQEIWAEKWRILKSAVILTGKYPYLEIAPETLADLCGITGFDGIEWMPHTETFHGVEALDFFQQRLEKLLANLPNEKLRTGFIEMATNLRDKMAQVGYMEIPFYRLVAQKMDLSY
jgi:SAM-dependent methyltransferase